jgi:GNAT superfamily N-acetyltransferase
VLALLAAAMKRNPDDPRFATLLQWKHRENPFGPSPAWVAESDGEVVAYRAFLRWEFEGAGRTWRAARAVDTATHPSHQGAGLFRRLTLHGLDALKADGVDFVFNTPNANSRPGYLKMGWSVVGRLRPSVRVRPRSLVTVARARQPASHWGEATTAGVPADEAFADDAATGALLDACRRDDGRFRTRRTPAWLRWRNDAAVLGSRVLTLGRDVTEGACAFRVRRRGPALEATVADLLVPGDHPRARRSLLAAVQRTTGADAVLLLGARSGDRALRLPGQGPTLVHRRLAEGPGTVAPSLERWDLSMGDVELL